MLCDCSRDLTFPWQPHFAGIFFKISISLILRLDKSFLVDHFVVFLFVLITFDLILDDFFGFWTNPEIQDGGPRWPPFRNSYIIITSCDIITS